MTVNHFKSKENNINSFDLVQAIDFLVITKQWNELTRFQASNTPSEFIAMVDKFREDDRTVNVLLKPEKCDLWIVGGGYNKINAIKSFRTCFGNGLADAKTIIESLPFRTFPFEINDKALLYCIETLEDGGCRIALRPCSLKPMDEKLSYCSVPLVPAGWSAKRQHSLEIQDF